MTAMEQLAVLILRWRGRARNPLFTPGERKLAERGLEELEALLAALKLEDHE